MPERAVDGGSRAPDRRQARELVRLVRGLAAKGIADNQHKRTQIAKCRGKHVK
jgi:hypothetical protein